MLKQDTPRLQIEESLGALRSTRATLSRIEVLLFDEGDKNTNFVDVTIALEHIRKILKKRLS